MFSFLQTTNNYNNNICSLLYCWADEGPVIYFPSFARKCHKFEQWKNHCKCLYGKGARKCSLPKWIAHNCGPKPETVSRCLLLLMILLEKHFLATICLSRVWRTFLGIQLIIIIIIYLLKFFSTMFDSR